MTPSNKTSTYQKSFPSIKEYKTRSKPPYYNERFALWLKPILDKLLLSENEDYRLDSKKLGVTKSSLKIRIHQAWAWLINNQDTDTSTYYRLRRKIRVCTEGSWIAMRYKQYHRPTTSVLAAAEPVNRISKGDSWREQLTDFIEAAEEGEYYEEPSLVLTEGDIEYIKIICETTGDLVILNLSKRGFKIIRSQELSELKRKED